MPSNTITIPFGIRRADTGELSSLRDRQREFIAEQYHHRFSCAYGGAGSGKTDALAWIAAAEIVARPGIRILCIHRDKTKAWLTLVHKIMSILPVKVRDSKTGQTVKMLHSINRTEGVMTYGPHTDNPATIVWMGLASETGQVQALQSYGDGFDLILGTQLEQLDEGAFFAMRSRLGRRTVSEWKGFVPRLVGDQQPGGKSHWTYRRWWAGELDDGESPDDYYVLRFKTTDNNTLDPKYVSGLASLPPAMKKRYYDGEDDDAVGLLFGTFNAQIAVVPFARIPYQRSWSLWEFLDWGRWPDPFTCLWILGDHERSFYVARNLELYRHSATAARERIMAERELLYQQIAAVTGKPVDEWRRMYQWTTGPSDMEKDEDEGKSRAWLFKHDKDGGLVPGMRFRTRSITDKEAGVSNVYQQFEVEPLRVHPVYGTPGACRLMIADCCASLKEQITGANYYDPVSFPSKANKFDDRRVRNTHAKDAQGFKIVDATHHWDQKATLELAVHVLNTPDKPEEPKRRSSAWDEIERAMDGYTEKQGF